MLSRSPDVLYCLYLRYQWQWRGQSYMRDWWYDKFNRCYQDLDPDEQCVVIETLYQRKQTECRKQRPLLPELDQGFQVEPSSLTRLGCLLAFALKYPVHRD